MALTVGSRIGAYEVVSSLGAGGMGEVYRATDAELGRDVAVKVLPEAFADDPDRISRFLREARVLARLNHASIASIYGLEKSDSGRALILELVEGPTLDTRLRDGPLPPEEVLHIVEQVADGLAAAHAEGIIHRDLKPANLKLGQGRAKILDFGLAKHNPAADRVAVDAETHTETTLGMVVGTVPYMSPEQALGRDVDARSDIFSLGVMIYEMLTGRRPFTGGSAIETIDGILHSEPPPLGGQGDPNAAAEKLARVARRCMAKDREQRYSSAAELAADLRADVSPREPSAGPPPSPSRQPGSESDALNEVWSPPGRRRQWEWDLILAVLLSPVLIYMAWFAHKLVSSSWGLTEFYVVVLSVLLATILRGTLLAMAFLQTRHLGSEVHRLTFLTRVMDLTTTAALLALAIDLDMSSYIVSFVLLTGLAAIGLVRVAVLIPLLAREAFPPMPNGRK